MALREDLEKTGNWLFRWRSYLPILMVAAFFMGLRDYEYPGGSETLHHGWGIVCLIVSFLGLGVRAFSIGYAPKGTSGRNTKSQVATKLNTDGIYSVVRNPLYLGNFLMTLGLALFVQSWWVTIAYILVFWIYYERIIFAEEEYLRRKFGNDYLEWADSTPVFVPRLRQYRKSDVAFSWKRVLRREYDGFFAVIALMFLMELVGEYYYLGDYELDTGWVLLAAIGCLSWIVLRVLTTYTGILKGRPRGTRAEAESTAESNEAHPT